MARDRPSPYGNPGRFFTVARGPVPRDRSMARGTRSDARVASEGSRPTVKGEAFFHRSAGPVPATLSGNLILFAIALLSWYN